MAIASKDTAQSGLVNGNVEDLRRLILQIMQGQRGEDERTTQGAPPAGFGEGLAAVLNAYSAPVRQALSGAGEQANQLQLAERMRGWNAFGNGMANTLQARQTNQQAFSNLAQRGQGFSPTLADQMRQRNITATPSQAQGGTPAGRTISDMGAQARMDEITARNRADRDYNWMMKQRGWQEQDRSRMLNWAAEDREMQNSRFAREDAMKQQLSDMLISRLRNMLGGY